VVVVHDDELVSAETGGDVAVTGVLPDDVRRPLDERRPGQVAVAVVYLLQVVRVEHADGEGLLVALGEPLLVLGQGLEAAHVVEFGEIVGEREPLDIDPGVFRLP
jgi:hypothetical protein